MVEKSGGNKIVRERQNEIRSLIFSDKECISKRRHQYLRYTAPGPKVQVIIMSKLFIQTGSVYNPKKEGRTEQSQKLAA